MDIYPTAQRRLLVQHQVAPKVSTDRATERQSWDSSMPPTLDSNEAICDRYYGDAYCQRFHRFQYHNHRSTRRQGIHDVVNTPSEVSNQQFASEGVPCKPSHCEERSSKMPALRIGRRHVIRFTADQIDCVCHVLSRAKNIYKLDTFIQQLTREELERNTEELCKVEG